MSAIRRRVRVAVIAFLTAGGLAACAAPQTGAESAKVETAAPGQAPAVAATYLSAGEQALAAGDGQAALDHFGGALNVAPTEPRAILGAAEAHLLLGKPEQALAALATLAEPARQGAAYLQVKGLAHFHAGDTGAARPLLEQAVAADGKAWRAWAALAAVYDRAGAWTEADAAYDRAVATAPQPGPVYNNRGLSHLARGEPEEAVLWLRKAVAADPGLSGAQDALAFAVAVQGAYEAALTGIPADRLPVALNNVGYAALLRGDYAAADGYLRRAMAESPVYMKTTAENLRWLESLRPRS